MGNKYFADSKMMTETSSPVSNEDFINTTDDSDKEIFKYLLEYEEDSVGYPYLVRGAVLRCDCGSHPQKLNLPICHGVYATVHPMVHELDCEVGDDMNIPTFGVCRSGKNPSKDKVTLVGEDGKNVKGCPCTPVIVGGKWLNVHPRTMVAQNSGVAKYLSPQYRTYYSALTVDSFLVCAYSGLIEPETSGQENASGE